MQHSTPSQPTTKPATTPGGGANKPATGGLQKQVRGMDYAAGSAAVKPAAKPRPKYGPGKTDAATAKPAAAEAKKFTTPQQLADPALAKDDKTHEREKHDYQRMAGKLFVRGVRAQDVAQGWLSDCYLAAALSSVAQRYPDTLKSGIRDMGGDVYKVRFYKVSWDGKAREQWVDVDADFPWYQDKANWAYLQSTQKGELWPSLYEKAYAVFKAGGAGDYDTIGQGGWEGDVMEALTGKTADSHTVADLGDDALWNKLSKAAKEKKAMTAGTFSEKGHDDPRFGSAVGIYGNHAYSVMGVKTRGRGKKKERFVVLRNPWGEGEPTGNGKDDGIFEISLKLFREKYEAVTILDE